MTLSEGLVVTISEGLVVTIREVRGLVAALGSSTVDQVLKYTKYPKYIPSTSTGQVLIFFKST